MLENDCAYRIRRLLDGIRQNPQHIFQHAKRMEKLREEHKGPPSGPHPEGFSERAFFDDDEDITIYLDYENEFFPHPPVEEARRFVLEHPNGGHSHQFFEMFYVFSGMVYCYTGGKEYTLPKGSIWIFNTQARHHIILGDHTTNLVNILLRKSTFSTTLINMVQGNDLFLNFFLNSLYDQAARPVHMEFHVNAGSRLEQHLYELIREYCDHEPYYQNVMQHVFSCILLDLTRQYKEGLRGQPQKMDQMQLISCVVEYISDHYATVTLQQVAEHFHYTTSYLSKYIQKSTGKSFSDLLTSFKMEKARQMLVNTSLPLGEISSAIGYCERSYFEKMFKRYYSITPFQYRKQHAPGATLSGTSKADDSLFSSRFTRTK